MTEKRKRDERLNLKGRCGVGVEMSVCVCVSVPYIYFVDGKGLRRFFIGGEHRAWHSLSVHAVMWE